MERLTKKERDKYGDASLVQCKMGCPLDCGGCEFMQPAFNRLAELEDKIENGTLIEKYFITKDNIGTMTWYNVCEVSENYQCFIIIAQFDNKADAEKRLKELRG